MAENGGLAAQIFALVKDLAKVEKDVAELGERGTEVQAALAGLDLGPVQEAIDHLEERTSSLQKEVQGLVPLRKGLEELSKSVKKIAEDLKALTEKPEEKLQVWNWSLDGGMDREEAAEAWEILVNWVRTELQVQYGWVGPPADIFANAGHGYGSVNSPTTPARIPPCWYRHREAVIELSWLCQEWIKIYRTSYGTPSRAGDWHDRYAPGVKRRLLAALAKCCTDKGHEDDPWVTDSRQPGAPKAIDDDEALSHWVGQEDLQYRPDPPPPGPVAATS